MDPRTETSRHATTSHVSQRPSWRSLVYSRRQDGFPARPKNMDGVPLPTPRTGKGLAAVMSGIAHVLREPSESRLTDPRGKQ